VEPDRARPGLATVTWAVRMVRRGAFLLAASAFGYMALEVASYQRTYPDGISPDQFAIFTDNPAGRMLQGVPHGIDSAGGFAAWDGGWVLQLIVGFWVVLVVTRLLRGEEETDRGELLLVGPIRPARVATLTLTVVLCCSVLIGAAVTSGLAASGADTSGSIVFGLGMAGFAGTFVGIGAICSQVVDVRRRAAGLAAATLGVAFVLRMVSSSTDDRSWVGWSTPFGWMEKLQPFGEPSGPALTALLLAPVVLVVAAVAIRSRRDLHGALLISPDTRAPHLRGLGGPTAFAWRSNQPQLIGWVAGLAAYAFVIGTLLDTVIDFISEDENYRRMMAEMGVGVKLDVDGILGFMGVTLGVGFALYAVWRMGSARTDEEAGRAENLLSRPVTRQRWLSIHAGLTVVGAVVLTVFTGLAMWAGGVVTGSDDVRLLPCLQAVLNTLPVALLFTGLAVLAFGLAPRLTVVVPAALAVTGYVLTFLGPALSWPGWVVDLSPFTHLNYVPAESFSATPAIVMFVLGCDAATGGIAAFSRRDLEGA
jgi:polyether ionophore transport system permease protein